MLNKPPDDLIGKQLGQFEILDEIGRGGMATVYRARQKSVNRTVAIKVLPRALLHDPSFYERFTREVDVIAHLEHPHILPIYDYGEADGVPYIAMRFLAGGSMAQLIRRGLPPIESLIKPMTQIAQALDYAHQQGIIHRDLKPGNILLDENGNAYLTDFGIARVINSNLTGSAIIGTPAYMSPEQANGFPLDARSDVYALGIVLFEMITGREPFEAETPVALLLKHINEPMPSPRLHRAGVPSAVEHVIYRATAKSPEDRYSSAGELAAAFAHAARQPATRPGFDAPVHDDQPTIVEPTGGRLTPPRVTPRPPTSPPMPGRTTVPFGSNAPTYMGDDAVNAFVDSAASALPPAASRRSNLPVIIGGLLALIAVIVLVVVAVPALNPPAPATPVPTVLPTPFNNSRVVRESRYAINVPGGWTFTDLTNPETYPNAELVHVWQNGLDAYISLWLYRPAEGQTLGQLADDNLASYFESEMFTLIDNDVAPDGSRRYSYRLEGDVDPPFEWGQTDVLFLQRGGYFVVMHFYAADRWGNDLLETYQQVLDSLRVIPAETTQTRAESRS